MRFFYTVWYRNDDERFDRQKSFRFADDAVKWLDSKGDGISLVSIYKHVGIGLDELIDDAWSEFGERSS